MLSGLWLIMTNVAVHSELADLLPEGTTPTQRLLLTQVKRGMAGRLLLLAIEGGAPDELAESSRAFSERLRETGHFEAVANGSEASGMGDREIVFRSRYLLSPKIGPEAFSSESLRRELEQRLDDLRSPVAPLIKHTIREDPTGETLAILTASSHGERPDTHRGVWISRDRSKALLVAETRGTGFDADAQLAVQRDVRRAFASLIEPSPLQLQMSGPGVFAAEIKQTIEREAWRLSTAAATLVVVFL